MAWVFKDGGSQVAVVYPFLSFLLFPSSVWFSVAYKPEKISIQKKKTLRNAKYTYFHTFQISKIFYQYGIMKYD
jgi:hypothetical protein